MTDCIYRRKAQMILLKCSSARDWRVDQRATLHLLRLCCTRVFDTAETFFLSCLLCDVFERAPFRSSRYQAFRLTANRYLFSLRHLVGVELCQTGRA